MNLKLEYQCQLQDYQARGDLEGLDYLDGKVKKQVISLFRDKFPMLCIMQ